MDGVEAKGRPQIFGKEREYRKTLAAGQPVRAHRSEGAIGPELEELLDIEHPGQILTSPAVGGMPSHLIRQDVSGLPGDMGLSLHSGPHPDLQGGVA